MASCLFRVFCISSAACIATAALPQPTESETYMFTSHLANVLSSEEVCGLSFDHDALGQWIAEQPEAASLSFANLLTTNRQLSDHSLQDLSGSSKVAHCAGVQRFATDAGFLTN